MKVSMLMLFLSSVSGGDYCYKDGCSSGGVVTVLYDVNPPEGFNLRRDVAVRMLTLVKKAEGRLRLALPPWNRLYHWRRPHFPVPWSRYFRMDVLNDYAPAVQLEDLLPSEGQFVIDTVYKLQPFEDPFEGGAFEEKWRLNPDCDRDVHFWGYNIVAETVQCVSFQGRVSRLNELISLRPRDANVMFTNAEIPLHDEYGTAEYWRARASFRFHPELVFVAEELIGEELRCNATKCDNYMSVHWRRGDFARGRRDQVPSVRGAAEQMIALCKRLALGQIFIATDAEEAELAEALELIEDAGLEALTYVPHEEELSLYGEGGVAIVDQIVCARGAHFVGTHESTFTYRIQEEREIMGFDSDTTFNRLCPDAGECERPSRWTIVH